MNGTENGNDVRVLKLRREPDLAVESFEVYRCREIRRQNFDDDLAMERQVVGEKHPRHAGHAQLGLEEIGLDERILQTLLEIHSLFTRVVVAVRDASGGEPGPRTKTIGNCRSPRYLIAITPADGRRLRWRRISRSSAVQPEAQSDFAAAVSSLSVTI
jgi:hypothetical protein